MFDKQPIIKDLGSLHLKLIGCDAKPRHVQHELAPLFYADGTCRARGTNTTMTFMQLVTLCIIKFTTAYPEVLHLFPASVANLLVRSSQNLRSFQRSSRDRKFFKNENTEMKQHSDINRRKKMIRATLKQGLLRYKQVYIVVLRRLKSLHVNSRMQYVVFDQ